MQEQTLYQDIAKRTGGDIYIGVGQIITQTPKGPSERLFCYKKGWERIRKGKACVAFQNFVLKT